MSAKTAIAIVQEIRIGNEFDNELDSFIGIQEFTFKAIAIIKILR